MRNSGTFRSEMAWEPPSVRQVVTQPLLRRTGLGTSGATPKPEKTPPEKLRAWEQGLVKDRKKNRRAGKQDSEQSNRLTSWALGLSSWGP